MLDESTPANGDRMMGFAGMERDTVTGLSLAVNRVENPGTGRWDSLDPLGMDSPDPNLYWYAENDPSGLVDPEGEAPKAPKPLPIIPVDGRRKIKGADPIYDKLNRVTVADIEADCEGAKALLRTLWFSILQRGAEQTEKRGSPRTANHEVIIAKEIRAYNQLLRNFIQSKCGGGGKAPPAANPPFLGPTIGAPSRGHDYYFPVRGTGIGGPAQPGFLFPIIGPEVPVGPLPNPGDPNINPGPVTVPKPVQTPAPGPMPRPIAAAT